MKIFRLYILLSLISLSFSQLSQTIDKNAYKSLIVPGWGQLELEEKSRSRNFFILEACSWLSFLGSSYANNIYIDDYMSFGSFHADINLNLINDNELSLLIVHMSQYDNMYEFNENMERQRRFNDTYPDTPKYQWDWDRTKNRNTFNHLRVKSSNAKKINNFTVAALIVNRIVSFIDVAYLNGQNNIKLESALSPTIGDGIVFNCQLSF